MRICMVSQYLPNIGGIENIVSDLAQRLVSPEGHRVSVVAPAYDGTKPFSESGDPEIIKGVRVYRFKRSKGFSPFGIDELRNMAKLLKNVCKEERIELIHAHYAKNESLVSNFVGNQLKIPVITTVHGSDIMDKFGGNCETTWSKFWVKYALKKTGRITTVSEFLKKKVITCGIEQDKISVIHNWIDPDVFDNRKCQTGNNNGKTKDSKTDINFRILTARRHVEKNGLDLLVKSLNKIENSQIKNNYQLDILSDGPEKNKLMDIVKRNGNENNVNFLGSVQFSEYLGLLGKADAFIVPSRWEGFGMVVLEGMAAGTPVVASDVGGIPEIIKNRKNGLLVKPDKKSIANGIIELYVNRELSKKIIKSGRKTVKEKFHYSKGIRKWIKLYESVKRK